MLFLVAAVLSASSPEDVACRRIENHLLIKDYASATQEATSLLTAYPHSLKVKEVAVKAFSRQGREKEALLAFQEWKRLSGKEPPRFLYEEIAWGAIGKGEESASPLVRLIATLAAFLGQDAKGVKVIERRLSDKNALVRLAATEVASKLPDNSLKNAVLSRLRVERDWEVRLQLIQATGRMKIKGAKGWLMELIADPRSTLEERAAATEALFALIETVPPDELKELSQANRYQLRMLAAEAIMTLQEKNEADILWRLIDDPHPNVRGQAVMALGVIREPIDERVFSKLNDPEFHVALAAAYSTLLSGSNRADRWVEDFIRHSDPEKRRLVAAMLNAAGEYGKPLARKLRGQTEDFYVKMNLSLLLQDKEALETLYKGVTEHKERWSRGQKGVFRPLEPSTKSHKPGVQNYPEIVNQETRLEILNLLAVKEHPQALRAVRDFLKESGWGISGISSALLLSEGDEKAPDQVRALLKDPDPDIRLQAAVILSRWSKEEEVLPVLKDRYQSLPREKKEVVLEAMGHIGDKESIDFLVGELNSPHATLRLMAAAVLIKSLYD